MSDLHIQEQRRIGCRFPVTGPQVYRADDDVRLGNLVNLTTEGLLLMGTTPVAVGETRNLCIRWQEAGGDSQEIRFQAESRWCQELGNPALQITGFAISRITSEELNRVVALICHHGFEDIQD